LVGDLITIVFYRKGVSVSAELILKEGQ